MPAAFSNGYLRDSSGAQVVSAAPGSNVFDAASGQTMPVKRAFATIAPSTTDGPIVAGVANRSIRVTSMFVVAGAAGTISFTTKPAGAGVAISPSFAFAANGGAVLPSDAAGWLETVLGQGLSASTGAGSVSILLTYVEVPAA